ncbi:EG45-like domain containing protein 2 [Linum perenne]
MEHNLHPHGKLVLLIATTVVLLISCLPTSSEAVQGLAVFHYPYTPSACYGRQNKGEMIAGVSDKLWNGGKACGMRYKVRCTGAPYPFPHPCKTTTADVVVTVTDYCDRCTGDINLSRAAFVKIANINAGKVRVEYDQL